MYPALRRPDIAAALEQSTWFSSLPTHLFDRIAQLIVPRAYASGELIHGKGDSGVALYGIASGGVRVSSMTTEGRESVFGFLGPGRWFGQTSLLDGGVRTHDARACRDTLMLTLARAPLQRVLDEYPILYKYLALDLCVLLRSTFETLEDEMLLSLQARLAKQLITLAGIYGDPHPDGVIIDLHLPQQDLADILQVWRQTINRKLGEWQQLGWIKMHYGRIVLMNRGALEQLFSED